MKKFLLFGAGAGALAVLAGCDIQFSDSSHVWSTADLMTATNVVRTAAIPAGLKALDVDNRFGTIHITGTDSGPTSWTWNLAVHARSDAVAQKIADAASCKAELDGDHLRLIVSLPESREPHSIQSDFEIRLPKAVSVRAENRFGPIDVSDLAGNVEAIDANGRVKILNVGGSVQARTSFDSLSVNKTGPATLKNQNGEIRAADIGGSLEAETSFDSLIVREVRGQAALDNQNGRIEASAVHGSLEAKTSFESLVATDISGAATLHNQNGRIEAAGIGGSLDANTSFDSLVAHNVSGPVHLHDQNGRIKIAGAKGDADIETSFDSLNAEGIQGDAVLVNQNGSVVASGITGSVKASTSFATMDITGAGPRFVCHNQCGAIRLRATSTDVSNIEANTSFDTLQVQLPGSLKPAIQAHTTFGEVESDFPVLMKPRGEEAFADVAPGTARITLQNQNGKIGVVRE